MPTQQHTSTYSLNEKVFLRAAHDVGRMIQGRVVAVTFDADGSERYFVRLAEGEVIQVGVSEIDTEES